MTWLIGFDIVTRRMGVSLDESPLHAGARVAPVPRRLFAILALGVTVYAAQPAAAETEAELSPPPWQVQVHGFVSQGFILTLGNEYLARGSTRGSAEYSEVGINFTASPLDAFVVGAQLFAQDLGWSGDYTPEFDWFYVQYGWRDWLGLRAGRLKLPYGLYNEVQDIDAARVPVVLPGSVYPLQSREVLFAQTGAELYGFLRMPGGGALDYRVFGGTIFLDADELTPAGAGFEARFDVPYVIGARVLWETPLEGLRLGGSIELIRLEPTFLIPGLGALNIENQSRLWVAAAEYAALDWSVSAEYSRWHSKQESDAPMLSPPVDEQSERAYVMGSYRISPWLQPGAYYSLLYPNVEERKGRQNVQHDFAVTLRFDINAHWIVKLEGHSMVGTAGLLNPLRINPPDISSAREYWSVYFLKTTAHF